MTSGQGADIVFVPSQQCKEDGAIMAFTLCGSLSLHPVSLGAAMHRAGYAALGLPWLYMPFAMTSERLADALTGMRALGIRGLGVSMPFKLEVMPLLDQHSELVRRIGACNTIVNDGGVLEGHNTDAEGAARALEEAIGRLEGARCLVLGAGGAARAVVFGLAQRGVTVTVANRTPAKAVELARAAGVLDAPYEQVSREGGPFDVLVNATSGGMDTGAGPGAAPLSPSAIRPGQVVMDIVYKPLATPLLEAARAQGARTVDGGRMLLFQAARQFELYTGQQAPLAAMDAALRSLAAP